MNEETSKYWPEPDSFNPDFIDEDFSFDTEKHFDIVRANVTKDQFSRLMSRALDFSDISERKRELIERELELIGGEVERRGVGPESPPLADYSKNGPESE